MPQAIPAAAAAFANWAFGMTGLATGTAAHAVVTATLFYGAQAVLYTGVQVGLTAVAQAQMPNPEAGKTTRKQPRPPRYYAIGGPSRMGGAYMLRETTGNKFGGVLAICEGRLASIDRIYLNDDRVTLSGGYVQGLANEKYGSGDLIRLDTRLGLPTETHYGFLTPHFGSLWPTSARGDGVASVGWLAEHRSKESFPRHYPNGEIIPTVVGPPVCFDWRDEAQDRLDESTWGPCKNPIVWLVFCEWHRHGRNWERSIEPALADLTIEADYCDDLVAKVSGTEPRYEVAGNYPIQTEPGVVRGGILASMDGWLSTNGQGHLIIKAGRYVPPTFTITGEHIEGYSWRAFQTDEEACNELIVSYVEPDQDYTEVEAGAWRDESDITDTGKVRSESLGLTWVQSRSQAMRLAKRKMTRLNAPRRGQVRTGIYGLNGLGERYIRVQNPELASMADVVLEVMNVEIDFAAAQVVFDVILADETIDAWDPAEEEGEQPDPVERPPGDPASQEPARTISSRSVAYPTSSTVYDTIDIVTFSGILPDGSPVTIPAGSITGLTELTTYGVFWKDGTGFEAEVSPATNHMTTGSWIFIGWQATPDAATGTTYPGTPTPPGGWGGDGKATIE